MRQATWNEVFAPRQREPLVIEHEVPREPEGWRRLLWWEDIVTLSLVGVMLLAVVAAVERARWVDGMPSLYPIAFFGLFMGVLLARLRWHEGFVHLAALPLGAAASLGMVLSALPGATPWDRYDVLHERMAQWFHIAFYGGISNDNLPVIVLVVPLAWLGAYLSAWAIFRWQNAWLAVVPGGVSLLINISVVRGAFGLAFVVYVLAAALLVTRMHLLERTKAWREGGTPYPTTISLSVLHATFWVALVLLGVAWTMPQADETPALASLWSGVRDPIVHRFDGYGRLFLSVNHRQGGRVHDFDDILPFLGSIELPEGAASLQLQTEPLEADAYLRAQAYYLYTSSGWRAGASNNTRLAENADTFVDPTLVQREERTIRVVSTGRTDDTILTLGQPLSVNRPSVAERSTDSYVDVAGLESRGNLRRGESYQSTGSVSVATEEQLRKAGQDYPEWVTHRYLQLPGALPGRVRGLAEEVTSEARNPYDEAVVIQSYLRRLPYDLNVPKPPAGADPVDYFLFEARRGYFDYHASAMVVMLRSEGIPARLAVGYVVSPDDRNPNTGRIRVTEANAYAWPEVFFPGYGWLEFNPTPDHPAISRNPSLVEDPGATTRDESLPPELGLGGLDNGPAEPNDSLPADRPAASGGGGPPWVPIGLASGFLLLLVSAAGGLRVAWLRGLSGLGTPSRLWGQTVRLAGWTRTPAAPGETPREFAARLRDDAGVEDASALSDAYVRQRFGRERIDDGEAQRLESAWRAVRAKLLRRLLPFVGP